MEDSKYYRSRHPVPIRSEARLQTMGESLSFYFKDRRGHFDWRALATVDVDHVIREVTLQVVQ
jgi:hypothetical protein